MARSQEVVQAPGPVPRFPHRLGELLPFWGLWEDDGFGHQPVAVEEFTEDGTLVIRAELPGIEPDKNVRITLSEGILRITAERSEESSKSGRHFHRRELRYGSFVRSLPIPEGVHEQEITASYKDGILEVRVPLPSGESSEPRQIPISRS